MVQHPQQQILSRSSNVASTFVPQTFQQPQQPAPAGREYILTIPETQMPTSQVIQPQVATKRQQQQTREQLTSFLVTDDQQPGPSSLLTFTLTLMKQFNPPATSRLTNRSRFHPRHTKTSCLSSNHCNDVVPFPYFVYAIYCIKLTVTMYVT